MIETAINNQIFEVFPELESERLIFRKPIPEDSTDILFIRSNDEIMKYMDVVRFVSIEDAEKFIALIDESYKTQKGITWGIIEKSSGKFIGYFGFWRMIPEHCRAEIGYALKPEFWGKGYMSETIAVMMKFGFNNIKLHSVEGNVNPDNINSIKVLEKFGFQKEAHFKENYLFDGRFLDSIIYSLLEKNFRIR
jgi:[ribosomal protein S5]-alanine N-acetyltransferase